MVRNCHDLSICVRVSALMLDTVRFSGPVAVNPLHCTSQPSMIRWPASLLRQRFPSMDNYHLKVGMHLSLFQSVPELCNKNLRLLYTPLHNLGQQK